jgi:hypothetical protein
MNGISLPSCTSGSHQFLKNKSGFKNSLGLEKCHDERVKKQNLGLYIVSLYSIIETSSGN